MPPVSTATLAVSNAHPLLPTASRAPTWLTALLITKLPTKIPVQMHVLQVNSFHPFLQTNVNYAIRTVWNAMEGQMLAQLQDAGTTCSSFSPLPNV